ncbi:MAG: UDP-N-acetylmuramoyl-L-alanine--D-glutamate ligase [Bacteroidetes bacterium 4572_112]|nr:MAG: UDP-N-acetylmuramoyl-L-alanine--D-glutamate ligase [Bacteroidetes bacterium 4572_112]
MSNILLHLKDFIGVKSVAIVGFGREGQSTYKFLRSYFPQLNICIADVNEAISEHGLLKCDDNISFELGEDFIEEIKNYGLLFKSPGISFKNYIIPDNQHISSQTDLFLHLFSNQTIGVTGTKGKSTTVSMLKFVLDKLNKDAMLIGNIGIPALDVAHKIKDNTVIVYELSSHQLEFVHNSPHISILLNLYQEHLDHYNSYEDYRNAKWNILKYQNANDFFIYCNNEKQLMQDIVNKEFISKGISYSLNSQADMSYDEGLFRINEDIAIGFNRNEFKLLGNHNINNLMAVLLAGKSLGVDYDNSLKAAYDFGGLEHRLEFVGEKQGVKFYNDSIATIPQACIKAMESVDDVDTLILGGFDRGIDYSMLINYLYNIKPLNLLLVGEVGDIIKKLLTETDYKGVMLKVKSFDNVILKALELTTKGMSVLLSPAASSYDMFKNFEERGEKYKALIEAIKE